MHRQFQLIAVVCGLMCIAGCLGGPVSPYQARECGVRLSRCFNSPICSHHRHRADGRHGYSHHGPACPPNAYCMPTTMCESGPYCGPVSECQCDNCLPMGGTGSAYDAVQPATLAPASTPPPAAPAESAAPAPAPVPDTLDGAQEYDSAARQYDSGAVHQTHWQEDMGPRVVLPGQRVSRRELRSETTVPALPPEPASIQMPLIVPAQRM